MKVKNTIMFIAPGTFYYGQGETIADCYADAKTGTDEDNFEESYKFGFDINDSIHPKRIIDTEQYCACYDDAKDNGQKVFIGTGSRLKEKALELCCAGKVCAMWVFPMKKKIVTRRLVETIKSNAEDYKRVAAWLGKEKW